jgi:hypothetical protein
MLQCAGRHWQRLHVMLELGVKFLISYFLA